VQVQAETYHVKASGNTGDGSSWESPTSLQSALDKAKGGDIIKVAQGNYYPTRKSGGENNLHGPRTKAFLIRENITIEGGYSDKSTPSQEIRNIALYPTILDGRDKDNSFNVVIIAGPEKSDRISPTLDGLTITGGYATDDGVFDSAVNVYQDRGIRNVVNVTKYHGGGLYNVNATPIIKNVIITGNKADGNGAGVYNDTSSPQFINVLIYGNTSKDEGGGIYNSRESNPELINATIANNYADDGGGIYNQSSFLWEKGAKPKLYNTIVYGNRDDGNNDNIRNAGQGTYGYCLIEGIELEGNNNLKKDTNPEWDVNFNPEEDSPLINAGSNSINPVLTDLNGNNRINQGQIDIGVYEYQNRPCVTLKYDDEEVEVQVTSEHQGEGNTISVTEGSNLVLSMTSVNEKITYKYGAKIAPKGNCGTVDINDNIITIPNIKGDIIVSITCEVHSIDDRNITFVFEGFPDDEDEKPQIQVEGEYVSNLFKLKKDEAELEFEIAFPVKYSRFQLKGEDFTYPESVEFEYIDNIGILSSVEDDIEIIVDCSNLTVNEYTITINDAEHVQAKVSEGELKVNHGETFSFEVETDDGYLPSVKVGEKELLPQDGIYRTEPITSDITINLSSTDKTYAISFVNGIKEDKNPIETYLTIIDEKDYNRNEVGYDKEFKFTATLNKEYSQTLFKVFANDESGSEISISDSEGVYSIESITSDITVYFSPIDEDENELEEWTKNKYQIDVKDVAGVSFSCIGPGTHSVSHGDDHTVEFTLQPGYSNCLKNVKIFVDGEDCGCQPSDSKFQHIIEDIDQHRTVEIRGVVRNYDPSASTYLVELPDIEGLIITPKPGGHIVTEGNEFQFELTLEEGYIASELLVKTDRAETLTPRESDGKYIISNIESDVKVSIEGVRKDEGDPTGNSDINNYYQVYSQENKLFVETQNAAHLLIFTSEGKVIISQQIESGQTIVSLTSGIYIIRVNNNIYKLYIGR